MKTTLFENLKPKLIYVFRINDEAHRRSLKIGEAKLDVDTEEVDITTIAPNSKTLNECARKRIDQYTTTAGIAYELLYTETASYRKGTCTIGFNDKDVHEVLRRSGIKRKEFTNIDKGGKEWYITDLETVKKAIAAVKDGRQSLNPGEITIDRSPIEFRPEQAAAIEKTVKLYTSAKDKSRSMLWNAKMRFGKTLCALQVTKEMQFERTLILTHLPVVDAGWFEDFDKIFYDRPDYAYGSKNNGSPFDNLEKRHNKNGLHYVYFASMQDLRGSEKVGGKFDKNNEIFSTKWDFIIIDEAHEGTQTTLGQAVIKELTKPATKILQLSGTPFNLMDKVEEDGIFTWDYTMEQRAKQEWDRNHFGDPNPYAGLPRMNIYTYDLGRLMHDFADEDVAFNFREFFRTDRNGKFVHHNDVLHFLNLLTKEDKESMYPFANARYRNIFRHTLWMLPGVKAAAALSQMLKEHHTFGKFKIVNVAGEGDEEDPREEALKKVNDAIANAEYGTITLSCSRLKTGVSVPQWTGVLMLKGGAVSDAKPYMQTIFRVQTPYSINGLVKEDCYVFDFAPDRTLQVLATVPRVSKKAGKTTDVQRQALGEFLNFCPVISMEGSKMKYYDANKMMEQLKKAYVERVVRNGFEDGYLYTDELLKLDEVAIKEFDQLRSAIGTTKAKKKNSHDLDLNKQGLNESQYAELQNLEQKKELTEEEIARLEELKKKQKIKNSAISILRGISIRMPLLIYGANISDENTQLTIDNFTNLVDNASWDEFMPRCTIEEIDASGNTKKYSRPLLKSEFNKFKKYYDRDIFTAAAKRIRAMARAADRLTIEDRIERITEIFSSFRNPDKETVLTPWRVVNMHMSDTLGGYTFYNEDFTETLQEPRYVEQPKVTDEVFAPDSHLLEINSKTGLYPLYLAYNLYRRAVKDEMLSPVTLEEHLAIWDKVIAENLFVICKTPMAKSITRRTLFGFREGKSNMWAPEDLINKIKNQPELFIKKVHDLIGKNVKINAIVGNPPYQIMDGGAGVSARPVYNDFMHIARKISPSYISMIMPSRWYAGGKGLDNFRDSMLKDIHLRLLFDFFDPTDVFPNIDISGGVCFFLWDSSHTGDCTVVSFRNGIHNSLTRPLLEEGADSFIRFNEAVNILKKIPIQERLFDRYVSTRKPFGISTDYSINHSNISGIKIYAHPQNGYIERKHISQHAEWIDLYKVYISYAYGERGDFPYFAIGKPFIGEPKSCCSETYLVIHPSNSRNIVENVATYLRTKFLRFIVLLKKNTQHATSKVYANVPLQDFTENSDIDWSKSVADIDRQLYAKYGLTDEEIAFIESMIKPM